MLMAEFLGNGMLVFVFFLLSTENCLDWRRGDPQPHRPTAALSLQCAPVFPERQQSTTALLSILDWCCLGSLTFFEGGPIDLLLQSSIGPPAHPCWVVLPLPLCFQLGTQGKPSQLSTDAQCGKMITHWRTSGSRLFLIIIFKRGEVIGSMRRQAEPSLVLAMTSGSHHLLATLSPATLQRSHHAVGRRPAS